MPGPPAAPHCGHVTSEKTVAAATGAAGIVLLTLASLILIWSLVDDLALRIALVVLLLLVLPAIVVIALDRRT